VRDAAGRRGSLAGKVIHVLDLVIVAHIHPSREPDV